MKTNFFSGFICARVAKYVCVFTIGLVCLVTLLLVVIICLNHMANRRISSLLLEPEIETIKSLVGSVMCQAGWNRDRLFVRFENQDITDKHVNALMKLKTMQTRLKVPFFLDLSFTRTSFDDTKLSFFS